MRNMKVIAVRITIAAADTRKVGIFANVRGINGRLIRPDKMLMIKVKR